MKPSDEQLRVIKNICNSNLIVEAVAGSGKTTTALLAAKAHNDKNFLLLTFNRRLSDETKVKIEKLGLKNIQVYTYHKFASVLYNQVTKDNVILTENLKTKKMNIRKKYDVLILDESQDMSYLYYKLITTYINEARNNPLITVMGDSRQSIYEFLDADSRYLTMADRLFKFNNVEWKKMKLSTTFRVNKNVVKFVNEVFFKEEFMNSNVEIADSIKYIICNPFSLQQYSIGSTVEPIWYTEMKTLIDEHGPNNTFILMYSPKTKQGTPPSYLSNSLSKDGYDVYLKESDLVDTAEDEIENKILISSFHGSKGLERNLVFVFGFDQGFYFHAKTLKEQLEPSNLLYVALTRSLEKLIIYGSSRNVLPPFIDKAKADEYISYSGLDEKEISYFKKLNELNNITVDDSIYSEFSVSKLLEFLPTKDLINLSNFFSLSKCEYKIPNLIKLNIKNKLEFEGKHGNIIENVSAINGSVLLSYYEYLKTSDITLLTVLKKYIEFDKNDYASKGKGKQKTKLMKLEDKINALSSKKILSMEDMCYVSTLMNAVEKETYYKFNQIKKYDWISDEEADKFNLYLKQFLSEETVQEKEIELYIPWSDGMTFDEIMKKYGNDEKFIKWLSHKETETKYKDKIIKVHISGRIDLIDLVNKNIFEFKIKNEIENIDYLQLLCYMSILDMTTKMDINDINFYIVNVTTNQHIKLNLKGKSSDFIYELITAKIKSGDKYNDEDFININLNEWEY